MTMSREKMATYTRKQSKIINKALDDWQTRGLLSADLSKTLRENMTVSTMDWGRLAKYAFWAAVASILISVTSALADSVLMDMLKTLFSWFWRFSDLGKSLCFAFIAASFYGWGLIRRQAAPQKLYSNGAVLFLGVLATAAAIGFLGKAYDTGSGHFSLLFALAAAIYCALGLWFPSGLVYVFGLLSLGAWFGGETGYMSGYGAYFLGMSWPLRFVLFGTGLTALSYVVSQWPPRASFSRPTLAMGLLYSFIALWIMSIFGNYTSYDSWWSGRDKLSLLPWALLFGVAACASIWHGLRFDDGMTRGFGITFLGINLYTRFFEYFWNGLHKTVFFAILAASLWFIGSHAERIWNVGRSR